MEVHAHTDTEADPERRREGRTVPLRSWIERALATADVADGTNSPFATSFGADPSDWPADIRRSLALASDSYLLSALKVARSLADQIRDVGESGQGMLPAPGADWAERAAVHLSVSNTESQTIDFYENGGGDIQPLPFAPQDLNTDRDLQAMLNSLIPDESFFTREDDEAGDQCVLENPYEKVLRAEILPSAEIPRRSALDDEMQRIYSLGIVFYELFSGGETHTGIKPTNGYHNQDNEPVPHGDSCTFDLTAKLNLLDKLNDLGGSMNGNLDDTEGQLPDRKRGAQKINDITLTVMEPLKMRGVPASLCELIKNMMDCINGDLRGEEAYGSMSDVCGDLELMLARPDRYLYDEDIEKLSAAGLQLNEALFGRDAEFSALKEAYERAMSGQNDLAIVVGTSGIGKSVLANRLGSYVTAEGGLFLSGKFDQLQQSQPFSALASAFNEYCIEMANEGRSGHRQEVAAKLRTTLGEEARHLVKVIPNLSAILGEDSEGGGEEECVDAQKRLLYLLCQFVEVISTVSGAPITLFLDDNQWADPASISAIHQLLMTSGSANGTRNFFFLGACRDEGLHEMHPFANMLSNIRQFGVHTTIVKLECMDKETTNAMISDLLRLSPRLTRSLSDIIHHKTKGNPLFLSKLLVELYKEGLVSLSLSRRRWVWDAEKIQSRKLPDDVAAFVSAAITRLPVEVQDALRTLSCFGASCNRSIIEALETKLSTPITVSLDISVSEGLLDKINNNTYSFAHDQLQEAAYNTIKPEERCLFHFKYGVTLVPRALELQDDSLLFEAAGQINRGGPVAVEDVEQSLLIANLNLTAGHKAMGMSDFTSAFTFFDHGISFLPKRHWQEQYDLSLALFDAACKCALVIGDIVTLRLLSEQVIQFAKSFGDTLNSMYCVVCALAYTSYLPESIERSLVVLKELGEELPDSLEETKLKFHVEQTKVMLQGFTDKELIEHKVMENKSKLMAMKFYARLELSFQMTRPTMQPIVTMKMVQLSIAHGMSTFSPIGLTYFGQLIARLGDIEEGCRYVKIARKILDRNGAKEVAGEVAATGTQILSFLEPVQATIDYHVQGQASAMSSGDTHAAMFNCILHIATSFWAGTKLPLWRDQLERGIRLVKEHGHVTFLAHIIELKKYYSLISDTEEDQGPTKEDVEAVQDVHDGNSSVAYTHVLQNMYLNFMQREFKQTADLAEKFFEFEIHNWSLLFLKTAHVFYVGLISFWIYRESSKDAKWSERGRKAKQQMRKWAESSQHNFQHKVFLLEAEEAYSYEDYEGAKSSYEKAVSAAREHRFVNDEALSCELAGYFFLKIQEKDKAIQYFMQAHEQYHEWGAVAKANSLFRYVQGVFSSSSAVLPSPGGISPSVSVSCTYPSVHTSSSNRRKRSSF